MIRAAVLTLAILAATPAQAHTCEQVRAFVAQHGKAKALAFALKHGATWAQIRKAKQCFRQSSG